MWALLDILSYSFSSLIWGVLIAVACMALFVFLIKGWYKDATFSPISYIVGFVLFIFLTFQCVLIVGSLKIIDTTDFYETQITRIVDSAYSSFDEISVPESDEIVKAIIDEYPLLQYYIGGGEFSGFTAQQLPHAIAQSLKSFMRWYIFRRVLWCLAFVAIGAFLVIKTMDKLHNNRGRSKMHYHSTYYDDF